MDDDQKQCMYVGVIAFTWTFIIWVLLRTFGVFGVDSSFTWHAFLGFVLAAIVGGVGYFVMQMNQ